MNPHDDDYDDYVPPKPVVSGSPDVIWLNYGELDRDCTHAEMYAGEDVTWCQDQAFDTDVRYVRADKADAINAQLLDILQRLALATDEGDDKAQGTHYIDKAGAIRCKGSFLALIEDARAAIRAATEGA